MCGIYGTVNIKTNYHSFLKELNRMVHRGPDDFGVWQNDDSSVYLGHRRLSIIDKSPRSNQPMHKINRYSIVYNGEIYNYIELRSNLKTRRVSFETESDTEVLLQLFIESGVDSFGLLNGMWAFGIYDNFEKKLTICRDRLGKKPLYYFHKGDQLAFSSEMKNLLCYLDEIEYDQDFVDLSITNTLYCESLEQTIYKGIKKLPAGSYAVFQNGKLEIKRYFFSEYLLHLKNSYKNFNEAVEDFTELFKSSCKLRMRSDVPIGSSLSGGIDSGFLVSIVSQLLGPNNNYKALISSFPGSSLDESMDANVVAKNASVKTESIVADSNISPDNILRSIFMFEEISEVSPSSFFQLYAAFRERNIVVSLDGHGSDELFGGYTNDLYVKIKDDFPNIFRMYNTLHSINSIHGISNRPDLKLIFSLFKKELKLNIEQKNPILFFQEAGYFKAKLYDSTFKGILPTLLRNYDKYSMSAGVEIRMPYLDHRLVEFAFSLPNDYKFRGGYTKAIVRSAGKHIMPEKILKNKIKIGWSAPMNQWISGPWRQWILDEISSQDFMNCNLINPILLKEKINLFYKTGNNQISATDIWKNIQPYLIQKGNKMFNV